MRWTFLGALMLSSCGSAAISDPYLGEGRSYRAIFVLQDGEQPLVTVFTSTPDNHLVTVDPTTGERHAEVALTCTTNGERPEVYPPAGGQAWVRCGQHEAYVVDLKSGQQVLTQDQLVAGNPDLASGFQVPLDTITYDVASPVHGLRVTLHDGRTAWVDMQGTLQFEPVSMQPWVPGYFCWPEHKCSTSRRECLGFTRAPGGQSMVLSSHRLHGESDRPPTPVGEWPAGVLMPGLIGDPASRCAFEKDDHYLILHDSAAFEPKQTLVSLYHRDGTSLWSTPYEALGATQRHQPRIAEAVGDQILLLIGNRRDRSFVRAAMVDASTGELTVARDLFGASG